MITDEDRSKPFELLSLYEITADVFEILKQEFKVPDIYELRLHHVDAAEQFLAETFDIAAVTLRKIQALRLVSKSGIETTSDVVVALAADLQRALDHLARNCADEQRSGALIRFKHQVMLAGRLAAGEGDIAVLK